MKSYKIVLDCEYNYTNYTEEQIKDVISLKLEPDLRIKYLAVDEYVKEKENER